MKHPHDNIRVGTITFVYSVTKRGWVFPGLSVIQNPLKAQRLAEEINNKRGAVCTKHPVELRTSIEMAHSLAQIGVRFVPIPVETDEEFHTLAASLSQKLEMMVAKAEADERDQV
ncbi:DUF1317 family protein [Escherichia coli]|nr:DUF1317 family protein [Escherichia coli]